MGAGVREKKEWEPGAERRRSGSRGPKEEGVGAGGQKKEWEPGPDRSGSRGPREETGSKGTSTKRRGDKDDGEHDTVTVIPGMYMRGTATSEHLEKQRE